MATIFSIALAISSVTLGVAASMIIFKLGREEETAMTKMKLKSKESRMDFNLFFYINLLMAGSALLYWVGAILDLSPVVVINRYMIVLYGVFLTLLFLRWWKRF